MSAALHRLGGFAARHSVAVIVAWLIFVVGIIVIGNAVGKPENDNLTLPGTGSQSATDLLDKKLPKQANGTVPIVMTADSSLAEGQNKQTVDAINKALTENKYVNQTISPFSEQGENNITQDGKIAYISAALNVS